MVTKYFFLNLKDYNLQGYNYIIYRKSLTVFQAFNRIKLSLCLSGKILEIPSIWCAICHAPASPDPICPGNYYPSNLRR